MTGAAALAAAWERSDFIFDRLDPAAFLARPIPLRQPFLFYLGHLPAFAWNHLGRALGRSAAQPALDRLFERGIDPPDDAELAVDPETCWPALPEVVEYRDRVREALRPALDDAAVSRVLAMVLEHELMHQETLLYMVQQLPLARKAAPERPRPRSAPDATEARVTVPAGIAVLGAPRGADFRWDNEHEEQRLEVPAFAVDALPVTNLRYLEFVEAGGYREPRLWSPDGWAWRERRGLEWPLSWRGSGRELRVATAFSEVAFDEASRWPACTSHCEAAAYARWRGGRLLSEAEFHRAAFGAADGSRREHPWGDAAPDAAHGNFDFQAWEPRPAGSHPRGQSAWGVHELVGNGWEWTSSVFGPLPGFAPLPGYPGYSADFFDGRHLVMLGGSWATDRRLLRRSFRNWFQPHYPYVFAKFRCAWPPE